MVQESYEMKKDYDEDLLINNWKNFSSSSDGHIPGLAWVGALLVVVLVDLEATSCSKSENTDWQTMLNMCEA